jgi:hypothetical protein
MTPPQLFLDEILEFSVKSGKQGPKPLRAEFLNCKRGWRFDRINELEKGLN